MVKSEPGTHRGVPLQGTGMNLPAEFETFKTLCTRRKSVRNFRDTPVTAEQVAAIREIARTAPYASGKKNWELLVVTDRTVIAELARIVRDRSRELGEEVRADFREMFLEYSRNFAAFESAPALFVPVFKVQRSLSLMLAGDTDDIVSWERENFVKSISCVTMLVLLAAEALGLAACCMTGPLLAEAEIARRIGIRRGFGIGALIPVGYGKGDV